MKFALHTFGCRVNQADAFDLEAGLRALGGEASSPDEADLVVVNTCTVTGAADRAARALIRRIARRNASARIVVTGCYATREPGALAALPGVVRVVPNERKADLVDDARDAGDRDRPRGIPLAPGAMGRTAYPLRVQTGCDESCAFCIVPSTRGPSRSRPPDDVLAGVARLAGAGYREIWLVGVHLGSYGRDLTPRLALMDLLRALDRAPGDVTFRLGSLEPMDCPPGLVALVARSGRFAPHLHLPVQHGCDRVLRLMRRPYEFGRCRALFEHIRARLPHASIGTDVIVGFPGESDADAEASEAAVASLPLSYAHVFPYSDRPGTAASNMQPKVPAATMQDRAARMRAAAARHAAGFAASQAGTVRPGLTIDDGAMVLTDNYLKVRIPAGLPRNVRVNVRIDAASPVLTGRPV